MSLPSTPTVGKRKTVQQQSNAENSFSGPTSWFTIIGGVMGEILQNWGILGALRKRGWAANTGARSTPSTPPPYGQYVDQEEIEMPLLNNPCYLRVEGMRPGQGHGFHPTTLERPSWCDACAHLVFYHGVTCSNCGFTCHEQCQDVVSLDCKTTLSDITAECFEVSEQEAELISCVTPTKFDDVTDELEVGERHEEELLSKDQGYCELIENEKISTLRRTVCRIQSQMVASSEIEEWVEKYSSANQGLQIAKEKDGSYRGCLRIHLNLSRPINIVAGTRPPSIYDILQEDRTMEKTLTSFYMPRDAVKAIHITSNTTTREVIIALLKKFKVVDNPQKFALYEKTYDAIQSMKAKLHRLGDSECPLVLAIAWGAQSLTNKRLVLQENDTADIQWDAFSLPELYNFLRILDKEETEYKNQIRDKYSLLQKRINDKLTMGKS